MEFSAMGFAVIAFSFGLVIGRNIALEQCNKRYLAMLDEAMRAGYPEGVQSPMKDKD